MGEIVNKFEGFSRDLTSNRHSVVRHIWGCCCEKDSNKYVSCEFTQNSSICFLGNWEHMWFSGKPIWKWSVRISGGIFDASYTFLHLLLYVIFNQYELSFFFSPVSVTFPLAVLSTMLSFKPWWTKYNLTETEALVSIKSWHGGVYTFLLSRLDQIRALSTWQ